MKDMYANPAALLMDIMAVLYEIHRSYLADVSVGDEFDSLLRAGNRYALRLYRFCTPRPWPTLTHLNFY